MMPPNHALQGTRRERCGGIRGVRAYLGGLALGLGGIGLFFVLMAIPITYLACELAGTGFPQGRTPAQIESDALREFWSSVWHHLTPWFVISWLFIGYGVFEAVKEQQSNHDHAA